MSFSSTGGSCITLCRAPLKQRESLSPTANAGRSHMDADLKGNSLHTLTHTRDSLKISSLDSQTKNKSSIRLGTH